MNKLLAQLQAERAKAIAALDALRPAIDGAQYHLSELQLARAHWQEFVAHTDELLADYAQDERSATARSAGEGDREAVEGETR